VRKQEKLKRRTDIKINLKTRNRVISSPRDGNITVLGKEDESQLLGANHLTKFLEISV